MIYYLRRGAYRSIMAYSTAGEKRINYYSNPSVLYRGLSTGSSSDDNARTLSEVRFAAARIGDESISCPTSPASSSATTTAYTSAPSTTSTGAWKPMTKPPPTAPECRFETKKNLLPNYPSSRDQYKNCPTLAETTCWHDQIKKVRHLLWRLKRLKMRIPI